MFDWALNTLLHLIMPSIKYGSLMNYEKQKKENLPKTS